MLKIEGYISTVIFRNKDNLYTVARLETMDGQITVVGPLVSAEPGTHYELTGHIVYHDKYGEQFEIQTAHIVMPKSTDSIKKYLSSGILPHIGTKTAEKIVDEFGEDSLEIIKNDPQQLKRIKGLGQVKIKAIAEAMDKNQASMDSIVYLQDMGFGTSQASRIYEKYKENTLAVVQSNPYKLIGDIPGIGFKIADRTALKSGFAPDSQERILAGLNYSLDISASQNGDTYIARARLLDQTSKLLDLEEDLVERVLIEKTIDGTLIQRKIGGEDVIYNEELFQAEELAATRLIQIDMALPAYGDVEIDQVLQNSILDEDQKRAVWQVFNNKLTVITGGPGTGKTSIVKAIVRVAEANGISYLLAAPTGRAAKRLEESTSREASTIHRMLKFSAGEGGYMAFDHDSDNPLEADLIIIDEASMVDIELMASLVDAILAQASLVFVGDIDQLPSVGPGNVLKDIINSGFAKLVRLKKIYRQDEDSTIVTNAHRINSGLMPQVNQGKDFFFLTSTDPQETSNLVLDLVSRRLPNYYDLNPMADIQVLSIMKKGSLGTVELNKSLQERLNPGQGQAYIERGDSVFRLGDKVIHQRNNYEMEYKDEEGRKDKGVYNGDMGIIVDLDPEALSLMVQFYDKRLARYERDDLADLDHSYAITIHKSQGSEFSLVLIPIFQGPYMLLTRNLIYTGVTRAKEKLVLVGDPNVLRTMVENDNIAERSSSLDLRMKEVVQRFEGVY